MSGIASRRYWPDAITLGIGQTLSWASSYYLPAILVRPMAAGLGVSQTALFAAFSAAMLIAALIGPWTGRTIDRIGGRSVLLWSNLVFAVALVVMGLAPNFSLQCLGWALLGLGMGLGLYDSAFAALAGIYGSEARRPITAVTLIAGFASTIGWPVSTLFLDWFGWRGTCLAWAALHIVLGLPLHRTLSPAPPPARQIHPVDAMVAAPKGAMLLLAFSFAATWFVSTAMGAHLPALLALAGVSGPAAIAAASLVGPAQVAARLVEFSVQKHLSPLNVARGATVLHPLGAVMIFLFAGPAAAPFALLHGAGNGLLTVAKGTLPLALFGPAGYGLRSGLLGAPARVAQAAAPVGFGWAMAAWGVHALWLTAGVSLASTIALLALRPRRS